MAKYRNQVLEGSKRPWSEFLNEHAMGSPKQYQPQSAAITAYEAAYQKYKKLVGTQPMLDHAINE